MINVRKPFIDLMKVTDATRIIRSLFEQGYIKDKDPIEVLLQPEKFKSIDYGKCPEDEHELQELMKINYELYANLASSRAWKAFLFWEGKEYGTFYDLLQVFLWTYKTGW